MRGLPIVGAAVALLVIGGVVALVLTGEKPRPAEDDTAPVAQSKHQPPQKFDLATRADGPDDGSARVRGTVQWWDKGGVTVSATLDDVCPQDGRRASLYLNVQNPNGVVNSDQRVVGPRCTATPTPLKLYGGGSADIVDVRVCEVAPGGREGPCVARAYRR